MCSPTAAVPVESLQRMLVAHHRHIRAAGGSAIALMLLLRMTLAGWRANYDGRRQSELVGVLVVRLWFLGTRRLGQLATAGAKLSQLKDLLQAFGAKEDALRFLL